MAKRTEKSFKLMLTGSALKSGTIYFNNWWHKSEHQFESPPLNHHVERSFEQYFYLELRRHIHHQSFRASLDHFLCLKNWPISVIFRERAKFISFLSISRQPFEFVWPHFLPVLILEFFRWYNQIWIFSQNSCQIIWWRFSISIGWPWSIVKYCNAKLETSPDRCKTLEFNMLSSKAIFAISKLNNVVIRCSNGTIISYVCRFHGFHESTLDITGWSCFDCSINKTFTAAHGVEEELGRS